MEAPRISYFRDIMVKFFYVLYFNNINRLFLSILLKIVSGKSVEYEII